MVKEILYLFPNARLNIDVVFQDDGEGVYIKEWNLTEPQPTQSEINAVSNVVLINDAVSEFTDKTTSFIQAKVDEYNKIGTTALNIQRVSYFHFKNLLFESFSANPVEIMGCLIGVFEDCNTENCVGGYNAITASTSSIGMLQSNLVQFNNCSFNTIGTWAVQWDSAANIQFNFCDFEYCGTNGNVNTGIVKATNFSPAAEGTGLVFNGCWGEFNFGTLFSIQGNAAAKHSFRDSMFQYGTASKGLLLNGGQVLVDNSTISFGFDITSGSVENRTSTIGTVTLAGTSLYKKYLAICPQLYKVVFLSITTFLSLFGASMNFKQTLSSCLFSSKIILNTPCLKYIYF